MKTTAIVVAAGSGTRFGSEIPKQFLEIHGKPIILHTLEKFQAAPSIDSIVLVLSDERIVGFSAQSISKIEHITRGGSLRVISVLSGVEIMDPETSIVVVHDGARPLVSIDEIERTVKMAKQTGAACLVAEINDTVKSIRGGEVAATLDRKQLRRAAQLLRHSRQVC